MKKIALISFITSIVCASAPTQAYMYSFTNAMKVPVRIDFCGIARIGCKMFGSHSQQDQNNHVQIENFGKMKRYQNAGWLYGPQLIAPGETAEFNFTGGDIGYCIELNSIQIQVNGGTFLHPKLQRAPNDYLNSVIENVDKVGQGVSKAGDAAGGSGNPQAEIAGKAASAIGGLLKPFADLYAVSACKDGRFVVGEIDGQVVVQTSDFGS